MEKLTKSHSAYGVAADLVLAIFPVFIIWNLQVSRRTKLGLASLMCLGVLCVLSPLTREVG